MPGDLVKSDRYPSADVAMPLALAKQVLAECDVHLQFRLIVIEA
jgi:hypothetical protein